MSAIPPVRTSSPPRRPSPPKDYSKMDEDQLRAEREKNPPGTNPRFEEAVYNYQNNVLAREFNATTNTWSSSWDI